MFESISLELFFLKDVTEDDILFLFERLCNIIYYQFPLKFWSFKILKQSLFFYFSAKIIISMKILCAYHVSFVVFLCALAYMVILILKFLTDYKTSLYDVILVSRIESS